MTRWAVTTNLGGANAPAEAHDAMTEWARSAAEQTPLFVFAQEVPSDDWLDVWRQAGYECFLGDDRGWAVRSALIVEAGQRVEPLLAPGEEVRDDDPRATLGYHGSHVAAARWASARGDVVLASVHASPREADPEQHGWRGSPVTPRSGGGDLRFPGDRLWDSDLLVESLRRLSTLGPLLAAGAFDEALGFDLDVAGRRLGTWGQEYFERVEQAGLTPWLTEQWGTERRTHGRLQLDHVLLSRPADGLLAADPRPYLDKGWSSSSARSDHTPIWFAVNDEWVTA